MLRAVVGGGAAVPDDLDDDLLGVRGHLELATLRGHQVVVPARPLVEREDEGVVALAGVGLRARDGDGHALAVDEADPLALGRDADGAVGERRAVVGLARAPGLQRDEALRDGDVLRARRVLAGRVVGPRRAELNGQVAEMRQRDLRGVAHPVHAVDAVLDRELVAVLVPGVRTVGGKGLAVVDPLHVVDVPRDGVLVDRTGNNVQLPILDRKDHVREVGAPVLEVAGKQAHVVVAGVGSGDASMRGVAHKGEVALLVEGGGDPYDLVALGGLSLAVIGERRAVLPDGYDDLLGVGGHLELALAQGDPVVGELGGACRREPRDGTLALPGVELRPAVGHALDAVAPDEAGGLELARHKRRAVVGLARVLGTDGHLSGIDDERAVLDLDVELARHIVADRIGHLGSAGNVVGVGADIGRARVLGGEARDCVHLPANHELRSLEAHGRMNLAVVGHRRRVRLDRDGLGRSARGHVQRALLGADLVVAGLGVLLVVPRDDGALARPRRGLRAGEHGVGDALACEELVGRALGDLPLARRERLSVVDPGGVLGLDDQRALRDVEAAVLHLEADVREVLAGVAEVARLKPHGVAARVGARHLRRTRERDVARVEAGRGVGALGAADHVGDGIALDAMLRAVILLAVRVSLDFDDYLLGVRADHELAVIRFRNDELAVSAHRASGSGSKGIRIVARIGSLAAQKRDARKRGVRDIAGVTLDALRLARVFPRCGIRREGHILVIVDVDDGAAVELDSCSCRLTRHYGISVDSLREIGGRNLAPPRGARRLGVGNLLLGAVEVIIHLVVGSVLLVVEDDFGRLAFDKRRFPRRLRRIGQVIAFDVALRSCRHDITGVPVEHVRRRKLLVGALLQVPHLASGQLVPCRRECDVVVGHGETRAAFKRRHAVKPRNGPASELVPYAGRLSFHRLRRALLSSMHESVAVVPASTRQIVDDLAPRKILGIEVYVPVYRVGELHLLS